jgi:hypothetical protein
LCAPGTTSIGKPFQCPAVCGYIGCGTLFVDSTPTNDRSRPRHAIGSVVSIAVIAGA